VICRLLCEDYSGRGSGVPDLIVWNDHECKFVEVKGPGDSLQENQKVYISSARFHTFYLTKHFVQIWIDVLLRAGAAVELCHVVERGFKKKNAKGKGKGKKPKPKKTRVEPDSDEEPEPILLSEDDRLPVLKLDDSMTIDEEPPFQGTKRHADELPLITPRKRIVNRAEVVILVQSPPKKRRMQA
jgi:fanconi-associated nuclease 1